MCFHYEVFVLVFAGSGEQLMRTLLAKTISDDLLSNRKSEDDEVLPITKLDQCIKERFLKNRVLNKDNAKLGGAVIILLSQDKTQGRLAILCGIYM